MINLNLNECIYKHPWTDETSLNKYSNVQSENTILLKKNLATYCNVESNNITITAGADNALREILKYTKPKTIYKYSPTYDFIDINQSEFGYNILNVELPLVNRYESMGFYNPKKGDLIYICNPNNPTGDIWSEYDLNQIITKYINCHIIIDEAYIEFSNKKTHIDLYNNVYYVRTFSKAFGLAGIRLGYIVSLKEFDINFKSVTEYAKNCGLEVFNNFKFYRKIIDNINEKRKKIVNDLGGNFICFYNDNKDLYDEFINNEFVIRKKYGVYRITIPLESNQFVKILNILVKYESIDIRKYYTPVKDRIQLFKLLKQFISVFKEKWWLDCGSFLGAVRHNGIIPWDDDIDIGVFNISEKNIELLSKYFNIQKNRTNIYYQICDKSFKGHPRDTQHIDIFIFHKNINGLWYNTDIRFIKEKEGECNFVYTDQELNNLKYLQFYNIPVPVPNKKLPDKYLDFYQIKTNKGIIIKDAYNINETC